jgi:CheY-like chemotaxis protein
MDIELAANGNEAVQKASEKQFGLILMDCQMPEKDGFTATREIRDGDGPNKNAPIVALTALAFPEDMEQCIKAGMNEYISKPFTREQLQALIHRYAPHT